MTSIRALECLVAVVERGSLTRAAAALDMSQPALSNQIAAIERELGTPVIEILSREIRPTKVGAAAAAEARIALAAADRAVPAGRQEAGLLQPLSQAEIRVLRYLPTSLSMVEIAGQLRLSANTVSTHIRHLYAKLGVHRRHEAVDRARALGLLAPVSLLATAR